MHRLENSIQHYDWGITDGVGRVLGRPGQGRPEAELWLGAHPKAPSFLTDEGATLLELIERAPQEVLGSACVERFGPVLPFLLKLLCAERPLSLQAHPSAQRAEAGFADEEARGIPLGASHRNYKDPRPKPELLCAVTRFEALCGFRPIDRTLALADALGSSALVDLLEPVRHDPGADALREVFAAWMHVAPGDGAEIVADIQGACEAMAPDGPWGAECGWIARIARAHPGDPGIVGALLLNYVALAPGQALYLPAGNLHAYLQGTGVEIMGNSDNVLRGGLTSKHVDVAELLDVLDFEPIEDPVLAPVREGPCARYPTPAEAFELRHVRLGPGQTWRSEPGSPRILLCVDGMGRVGGADGVEPLSRGQSLFAVAPEMLRLSGPLEVYQAAVPGFDA